MMGVFRLWPVWILTTHTLLPVRSTTHTNESVNARDIRSLFGRFSDAALEMLRGFVRLVEPVEECFR
jgi:hypothetical protein